MFLKKNFRTLFFCGITGVIIGFCYVAGYSLEKTDSVNLTDASFYLSWFLASVLAFFLVGFLWNLMKRWGENKWSLNNIKWKWFANLQKFDLPMWGYLIILFLCWIPTWLSIFPGAFAYDAYDEWKQISENDISSHHPVLHVLWLGGLTEGFYQLTGSYNLGIAIYTAIQMLLLATTFAYSISALKEWGAGGFWKLCALLFYAISPVIQLFSVSGTKDTLFAAVALLFFLSVLRLTTQTEKFFKTRKWQVIFVLSGLLTMILRNNGLYIALLTLLSLLLSVKKYRKKLLALSAIILVPYFIYTGPIYNALNITPGGIQEMLSVPIQQMARVHYYEKDSLNEKQLDLMYEIIPQEDWEAYRPTVSDFVKKGFRPDAFDEKKSEFFKLWMELGIEHPLTYINSFLLGTVDFWYPHAIVDGYRDVYGRSSFFDYRVAEPGTEIILLENLHEAYEYLSWDKEAQKIPGLFLLISQGLYFQIAFIVFMYIWKEKEYRKFVAMMILMWNMATVFLGPIALVRYVLILFYVFPLLPAVIKKPDD